MWDYLTDRLDNFSGPCSKLYETLKLAKLEVLEKTPPGLRPVMFDALITALYSAVCSHALSCMTMGRVVDSEFVRFVVLKYDCKFLEVRST